MEFFLSRGGARSVVYAGLDSIVTSLSLVFSISGGHGGGSAGRATAVDVVVLGFANLVADGIAMGLGDFLSSATARDMAAKDEEERVLMVGVTAEEAAAPPWKSALVTFFSFIGFGSVPLLAFVVLGSLAVGEEVKFVAACLLAGGALALLGAGRARVSGQGYALSVAATLLTGATASASAFTISWLLRNVVHLE